VIRRAGSLAGALELAEELRAAGACDWFRGQTRNWPLLSSFGRRDEAGQQEARERLGRFVAWLEEVPELAAIAADRDAALAVAQHYGIPTNLVDFTTEPAVAAFFAAHDPPAFRADEDTSCIVCLDTAELASLWETVGAARPELPEPAAIRVEIDELWRLQSQRGAFLFFPFDEGFERTLFAFDRIVFPPADDGELAGLIPVEDVYPTQKSELEILLDRYFMLERMREGDAAIDRDAFFVIDVGLEDGIERECFGPAGLPVRDSWSGARLAAWETPAAERWTAVSEAPELRVAWPSGDDPAGVRAALAERLAAALAAHLVWRAGPVRWEHAGDVPGGDLDRVSDAMSLLWDGLRRWPFADGDVATGLATAAVLAAMVAADPRAVLDADELATAALGPGAAIGVEIGMGDGSYTRGYASAATLEAAVRGDFAAFLNDEWRPQIDSIWSILEVARVPCRVFRFDALAGVFAREIAATQVALRGEESGKARLCNPAQAESLGLP
jgi:hypothetical protein